MAKVILFSYTPNLERVCAAAMRSCYSPYPAYELYTYTKDSGKVLEEEPSYLDDERVKALIKKALRLGHHDVLEHGSLTYDIQEASRVLTHQLVRHRLASFSQQSQRYVKVTKSFGYVRPPEILSEERVAVHIKGKTIDLSFEDLVDITKQMEEGYLRLKKKAEDARFIRIAGATTNIVITANPREFRHIFNLRCARDAQWEIQDVAYAMLATAKLVAPNIFSTLPIAEKDKYVKEKLEKLDRILNEVRPKFLKTKSGELMEVPLDELKLHHKVRSFIHVL